jgi:hypothetical protein
MEKITMTIDELNAAIGMAVNAAMDARDSKGKIILISRKATADRLHVNESTLWRWKRAGYLMPAKTIGRRDWYAIEDIELHENGIAAK